MNLNNNNLQKMGHFLNIIKKMSHLFISHHPIFITQLRINKDKLVVVHLEFQFQHLHSVLQQMTQ